MNQTFAQIGFTAPARIWPKIDDVEARASALNTLVQRYVGQNTEAGRAFKQAWDTWYSNWRRNYYERYQGTFAKLSALSGSDELNRQVEDQREALVGFYNQYERQRQADGAIVPPAGPRPQRAPEPGQQGAPSWSLPWWFWVLTGAATVGIGYAFYRRYRQVQAQAEIAERTFLPAVFERYGLPGREATEIVQAGHRDVASRASRALASSSRGLPPSPPPRTPRRDPFSIEGLARDFSVEALARDYEPPPAPSLGPSLGRSEAPSLERDSAPNFAYDRSRDPFRL